MSDIKVFENELFKVSVKTEAEEVLFDVEQVAINLGLAELKNNKKYVMWRRVNQYIKPFGTTAEDLPQVAKGDFIPEPLVYKLAFKASNELAEKFQDWLAIEVIPQIRKTGSYQQPKSQAELIAMIAQHNVDQEKRLSAVEQKQDSITELLSLNPTEWRKKVNNLINRIAQKYGGFNAYKDIRQESYDLLEDRAHCQLSVRLTNKKRKMALEGASKSKIDKTSKMDVIADDSRLTEIYLAIVKELAIKYDVEVA